MNEPTRSAAVNGFPFHVRWHYLSFHYDRPANRRDHCSDSREDSYYNVSFSVVLLRVVGSNGLYGKLRTSSDRASSGRPLTLFQFFQQFRVDSLPSGMILCCGCHLFRRGLRGEDIL